MKHPKVQCPLCNGRGSTASNTMVLICSACKGSGELANKYDCKGRYTPICGAYIPGNTKHFLCDRHDYLTVTKHSMVGAERV